MAANPHALQDALAAVRTRWGVHSIVPLGTQRARQAAPDADASTPPLWWPTPGTAPAPQLLELSGPASSGKLTLALLWLAALPLDGPLAIVDVAGTVYPPAAAACGLDLRRLVVVRPPQRRDLLRVVLELTRSEGFDAVLATLDATASVSLAEAGQLRSFAAASQTSVLALREGASSTRSPFERPAPSTAEGAGVRASPLSPWERARVRVDATTTPATPNNPLSLWERDGVRVTEAEALTPEAALPLADTRLRIVEHVWLWEDGELAGQRLRLRTERSRQGLAGTEHELTLRLSRRGTHGTRPDHLYLDSARRTRGRDPLAATGS